MRGFALSGASALKSGLCEPARSQRTPLPLDSSGNCPGSHGQLTPGSLELFWKSSAGAWAPVQSQQCPSPSVLSPLPPGGSPGLQLCSLCGCSQFRSLPASRRRGDEPRLLQRKCIQHEWREGSGAETAQFSAAKPAVHPRCWERACGTPLLQTGGCDSSLPPLLLLPPVDGRASVFFCSLLWDK